MWLLDAHTAELHYYSAPKDVPSPGYAILSHRWLNGGRDDQTFQDVQRLTAAIQSQRSPELPDSQPEILEVQGLNAKISQCCALARVHGFRYVWIDTCCIDRTSSAELTESLNSMFQWYARAAICYAFLYDVKSDEDPYDEGSSFRSSEWFTRCWTLQELLAPSNVLFLSVDWFPLGTKESFSGLIQEITGIDRDILIHRRPLDSVSIARRMSWASKRRASRVEDEAYSLMGIFGVNMPTIYGEQHHAFIRLQQEILKGSHDQSIFACYQILDNPSLIQSDSDCLLPPFAIQDNVHEDEWEQGRLLASSPVAFADSADISSVIPEDFADILGVPFRPPEYNVTSCGMRMRLPLLTLTAGSKVTYLGILSCRSAQRPDHLVALFLTPLPQSLVCLVGRYIRTISDTTPDRIPDVTFSRYRAILLPTEHLRHAVAKTVYVPYRFKPPSFVHGVLSASRGAEYFGPCAVDLLPYVRTRLQRSGYTLRLDRDDPLTFDDDHGTDRTIILDDSQSDESIAVHVGLCYCSTKCCAHAKWSDRSAMFKPRWSLSAAVRVFQRPAGPGVSTFPGCASDAQAAYVKRHIRFWDGGAKTFRTPGASVTLRFSSLANVGAVVRYSLIIEIQRCGSPASTSSQRSAPENSSILNEYLDELEANFGSQRDDHLDEK
ncbi:heterokaryon incompatibility protein-domain-containing protein [Cubamyces lactineus]|nr:heterokaryon incompatibility protein-domain-containing protein [Cubamyces lactineus]